MALSVVLINTIMPVTAKHQDQISGAEAEQEIDGCGGKESEKEEGSKT